MPLRQSNRVELTQWENLTCFKEERDALEEMREINECDTEKFGTLYSSDNMIVILGDRWWPQTARQEGQDKISKCFLRNLWEKM